MDTVGNRLHAGLSWLTSAGGLWNLTMFDSLSVPFTDSQPHSSAAALISNRHIATGTDTALHTDQDRSSDFDAFENAVFGDSPWGFVASRYALTLGVMAVVVNRITHICRPQGRPRPLPASRRLAIQLPTMMFLGWSGILLLLVTLNSFFETSLLSASLTPWLPPDVKALLGNDENDRAHIHAANSALLWRLFLSVCFAVVSSTLLRTLEGHNTIVNPDDLGNSPTFNLVGFAVLLHLHASSHAFPPNKHVYLSILFQVGEVLGLQACTCWSTPPVSRLTLTSIFGLTSTVHYLLAIRSGDRGYPFLQSFSRAPDVALIAVILLTIFLHALTAVITSTPLSFARLIDPRSLPLPSDDYSLALFKLGTACLSSTRLSGLDADLIDIRTLNETWIEVNGSQVHVRSHSKPGNGFDNEIRRMRSSSTKSPSGPFRSAAFHERWRFVVFFMSTIRGLFFWTLCKVKAILPFDLPDVHIPHWIRRLPRMVRLAWHGTNGEQRRQRAIEEQRRRQEQRNDAATSARLEGAGRAAGISLRKVSSAAQTEYESPPNSWHRYFTQQSFEENEDENDQEWTPEDEAEIATRESTPMRDADTYWGQLGSGSRLMQDIIHENDEDLGSDDDAWQDDIQDNQHTNNDGDMSAELLSLARRDFDESEDSSSQDSYARILLAHMSSPSSRGILTRSAYRDLSGVDRRAHADAEILSDVVRERRQAEASNASERERMRLCVICYVEDRTIICWPCKCLALCDACREAMAARPPPRTSSTPSQEGAATATHTCPTCRTPVLGFSRIYLP